MQEQLPKGFTYFAENKHGIRLAAEIVEAVPCAQKVRFVSSGTEADAYAMRVARAFRRRDKILKFEGGYHGMGDYSLMSLSPKRPGNFPAPVPDSPGIPERADEVLIAPFNDADMAASLIKEHRDELGGVIVEPFQRLLAPQAGLPGGAAGGHARARDPADLRRGGDGVPLRLGRRARVLRRHAGPMLPGQDHRRRVSAGRDRGPGRHHGAVRSRPGGGRTVS